MANIMKIADLKNHTSRNGFDLSFKSAFTSKVGEILPIGVTPVIPGDKFNINLSSFSRTMPVNTAAYTRIREYIDVFYVPYRLLWNKFDTFITSMTNNPTHATGILNGDSVGEKHPYFTVKALADYVHTSKTEKLTNGFGYDRADLTVKLLDYLDYGDYSEYLIKDWSAAPRKNYDLSPWSLLGYQKVVEDYFRDDQWQSASPYLYNVNYMDGSDLKIATEKLTTSINKYKLNMFDLEYCNWEKDYYFGVLPDSQYGTESVVPLKTTATDRVTDNGHYLEATTGLFYNKSAIFGNANISAGGGKNLWKLGYNTEGIDGAKLSLPEGMVNKINSYVNDLSILRLRQAEYLQRWKEVVQSGDQDFKTQINKIWGVTVPNSLSNKCAHVGGSVTNLDITEVINTNLQNDAAADIAGQGRGAGSGYITFDNNKYGNEYGLLLFMYHARPLLDYATDNINRHNMKTQVTDYANPMFDKLGNQELYLAEIDNSSRAAIEFANVETFGYVPRYCEYKTSIDKVKGEFKKTLNTWVAPITSEYFEALATNSSGVANYEMFKVNPNILNPIFVRDADSTTESDTMLVNANFDIKAVRNLDYNGLPY